MLARKRVMELERGRGTMNWVVDECGLVIEGTCSVLAAVQLQFIPLQYRDLESPYYTAENVQQ